MAKEDKDLMDEEPVEEESKEEEPAEETEEEEPAEESGDSDMDFGGGGGGSGSLGDIFSNKLLVAAIAGFVVFSLGLLYLFFWVF